MKADGRGLYLATASNEKFAHQIAEYLGIFDGVIASSNKLNMSGSQKLKKLIELFGDKKFGYAGNANVDMKIWANASEVIVVNPNFGVEGKVKKSLNVDKLFSRERNIFRVILKALRSHQWSKNILVFVPLVISHQLFDSTLFSQAVFAFISFSLCASSVYILNDLLDLKSDRQHVTKKRRPFASGELSILAGIILVPILLLGSTLVALLLPVEFIAILGLYYFVTVAYSFGLKDASLVDILILAGLYTIRILAGAAAISVTPSFWLLAFSMFLFFSLASVKRYAELLNLKGREWARGYQLDDMDTLSQIGISSGFLSVLVMALYINSELVKDLYSYPEIIWLICPMLMYWISRVWLLTRRGLMDEDPVVFAIKDKKSHATFAICMVILWFAV